MSNCPLCNLGDSKSSSASNRPPGRLRRAWRKINWVFPTALLILMPKCPLCVAAYIALFTGVGISVSTARWLQILMLVLCLGSLTYLAVKFIRRKQAPPAQRVLE